MLLLGAGGGVSKQQGVWSIQLFAYLSPHVANGCGHSVLWHGDEEQIQSLVQSRVKGKKNKWGSYMYSHG